MSRTLVCAIQIGTSRIHAAAAWRDQFGSYEIQAIEQEPTEGAVRRGCIVDIDATAKKIQSLIQKLSDRVKVDGCLGIEAAYVGIDGISMHSEAHHPSITLENGKSVDNETTAALRQMSRQNYITGYDVLNVETTNYTLDDIDCLNPNGRTGDQLVAHHQLIVAQQRLRLAVRAAMKLAEVRLVDVLATPSCIAQILTPDEKQRGCVLLDIGHSLTSVSVFANGALQHLATIPLGSNAVTKDLAAARDILTDDAEREKIAMEELDIVSRCRFEEIAENVMKQIELSGCKDKLGAGCVVTGGASMQKGLLSLLGERLGISRIMARGYSGIVYGISDRKPHLAALTTMLPFCTANCAIEVSEPEPELFDNDEFENQGNTADDAGEKEETVTAAEDEKTDDKQPVRPRGLGLRGFFRDLISGIDD